MSIPSHRVRIEVDVADPFRGDLVNRITGQKVELPRGADIDFELAIFWNGTLLTPTNISQVRLRLKPATNRTTTPVMDGSTSTILSTLTQTQWDTEEAAYCHAKISFPAAQTALTLTGDQTDFWAVIDATTSDAKSVPLAAGLIEMEETGANATLSPPVPADSYFTKTETLAQLANVIKVDNAAGQVCVLRNAAGQGIMLRCDDNQELLVTKL
jgi:hypothetical protein